MRSKTCAAGVLACVFCAQAFAAETAAPKNPGDAVALRSVSEDQLFDAYRTMLAAQKKQRPAVVSGKSDCALELALAQERERNRQLTKENELFKSSYDVVLRSTESEHGLKTQVAALEEELRLRNKELIELRRENAALLEKNETAVALRVQKYAEENARLERLIGELKERSGKTTQEMVAAYERRIAMLEDHLDTLTGGTWKMLKDENGEDAPEMKAVLERLRKQKSETAEIALRIDALEKAYAVSEKDAAAQGDPTQADKDRSELYFRLGKAYVRSGEYQQAIESFLESVRFGAAPVDAHYFLGLLYQYAAGDRDRSVASLRKYLYLAPSGTYAAKADAMLAASGQGGR